MKKKDPPSKTEGGSPAQATSPALQLTLPGRRARAILLNFAEVVNAHRTNRKAIDGVDVCCGLHRGRSRSRAAIRPKAFRRDEVALHRTFSRRADRGHQRGAASTECFLYGGGEWRGVEDHRLREHLESDF